MMSLENEQEKSRIWNSWAFLFPFWHWHVKGFSSKRIALKVDVTGPEDTLFAGTSLHLSAPKITGWGDEGVNCFFVAWRWCLLWKCAHVLHCLIKISRLFNGSCPLMLFRALAVNSVWVFHIHLPPDFFSFGMDGLLLISALRCVILTFTEHSTTAFFKLSAFFQETLSKTSPLASNRSF